MSPSFDSHENKLFLVENDICDTPTVVYQEYAKEKALQQLLHGVNCK